MAHLQIEASKDGARTVALGTHRVADAFIPAYETPMAIRLPAPPRQAYERRQLGRVIERRRLSS